MNEPLLFTGARFYSLYQEGEYHKAVLVQNGMIEEVFAELPARLSARKVDLGSAYVYPGFIDTHTHSFEGGLYALSVNLENVESIDDLLQMLKEAEPISGKIFAFHFDENLIREKRFPTRTELDKVHPRLPLLLRRIDGHSCVINSAAFEQIDWKNNPPPDNSGHLNRRWNGLASNWFHRDLDDESILQAYHKAAEIAIKNGHTAVHTMIGDSRSDIKHYRLIRDHLEDFPVEFILYPQISDVSKTLELRSPRIGGCILADGSFGSHTAALKLPYRDRPDSCGVLYRKNEAWMSMIREAHRKDLQVAVHCIGDAAVEQILHCYETVQQEDPRDLRHELIHNELTSDEMLDRMEKAKVAAVMQPMFDRLWAGPGGLYERVLGRSRTLRTNRLASIYRRGILLTGGSDWYITELNALKGIKAAVNLHNPEERLTPYQAVQIYTSNAARLSHDEDRLGQIIPGKQADFVCLDQDIFTSPVIDSISVLKVIKKGQSISFRS